MKLGWFESETPKVPQNTEISKHDLIKAAIFFACNDLGFNATQEYKGKDWRADVYVATDSKKFAFEIQMSPQSLNRTLERQNKYIRDGVIGCWLFEKPLSKLSNERQDLPLFYVAEQGDRGFSVSLSGRKDLQLHDFLRQFLSGKIKFCNVARTTSKQKVVLVFYEMQCWKCKEINHIYYVKPWFRAACNAAIYSHETLWGSGRNAHRPEIIALAREFVESEEGKHIKLGEIKQRSSQTVQRSYMSFGCYECDSIFGDWFVMEAELEVAYGYGQIATIERSIKLGENIELSIPHWCYPGELPFCDSYRDRRESAKFARNDRKSRLTDSRTGAWASSSQDYLYLALRLYEHSAAYARSIDGNCSPYPLSGIPILFSALRAMLIETNSGMYGLGRDRDALKKLADTANDILFLVEKYHLNNELADRLSLLYEVRNEIIHPSHMPAGTSHGTPNNMLRLRELGLLQSTGDDTDYVWISQLQSHRLFQWGFSAIEDTALTVLKMHYYTDEDLDFHMQSYAKYKEYDL